MNTQGEKNFHKDSEEESFNILFFGNDLSLPKCSIEEAIRKLKYFEAQKQIRGLNFFYETEERSYTNVVGLNRLIDGYNSVIDKFRSEIGKQREKSGANNHSKENTAEIHVTRVLKWLHKELEEVKDRHKAPTNTNLETYMKYVFSNIRNYIQFKEPIHYSYGERHIVVLIREYKSKILDELFKHENNFERQSQIIKIYKERWYTDTETLNKLYLRAKKKFKDVKYKLINDPNVIIINSICEPCKELFNFIKDIELKLKTNRQISDVKSIKKKYIGNKIIESFNSDKSSISQVAKEMIESFNYGIRGGRAIIKIEKEMKLATQASEENLQRVLLELNHDDQIKVLQNIAAPIDKYKYLKMLSLFGNNKALDWCRTLKEKECIDKYIEWIEKDLEQYRPVQDEDLPPKSTKEEETLKSLFPQIDDDEITKLKRFFSKKTAQIIITIRALQKYNHFIMNINYSELERILLKEWQIKRSSQGLIKAYERTSGVNPDVEDEINNRVEEIDKVVIISKPRKPI